MDLHRQTVMLKFATCDTPYDSGSLDGSAVAAAAGAAEVAGGSVVVVVHSNQEFVVESKVVAEIVVAQVGTRNSEEP